MQRRRALSSVYGFILIFLLSMASIQTWSYAVSSEANVENAFLREHQIQQMQSEERLRLTEYGGNLTIANVGQIPSTVKFLRLLEANGSRTLAEGFQVPAGTSIAQRVPQTAVIQVITSLGNTFVYSPPFGGGANLWSGIALDQGLMSAQLFNSPYDPTRFFMSAGQEVYAFSTSGSLEWSFDAGSGFVTDILPLSTGDVYVSTGYGSSSNAGNLFELSSGGSVLRTFPVRVFQTAGSSGPGTTLPVVKGLSSQYALYDGWLYSASGSSASLQSDSLPFAGSDSSDFYFYRVTPVPYVDGSCESAGTEVLVSSYLPSPSYPGGVEPGWNDYTYLGSCNRYPPQLVSSAVGNGVVATLFASAPYAASPSEAYPPENPYLVVVSTAGDTLFLGHAPSQAYTSLATNGTDIFLALPALGEVQDLSLAKNTYTTVNVGIPASRLLFVDGRLFAISSDTVKVFTASMILLATIDLAPLSLASWSDSFVQEQALTAPSFLVLNSTNYAALLDNGTAHVSLVLCSYP